MASSTLDHYRSFLRADQFDQLQRSIAQSLERILRDGRVPPVPALTALHLSVIGKTANPIV
jgi:hypothetical protein